MGEVTQRLLPSRCLKWWCSRAERKAAARLLAIFLQRKVAHLVVYHLGSGSMPTSDDLPYPLFVARQCKAACCVSKIMFGADTLAGQLKLELRHNQRKEIPYAC